MDKNGDSTYVLSLPPERCCHKDPNYYYTAVAVLGLHSPKAKSALLSRQIPSSLKETIQVESGRPVPLAEAAAAMYLRGFLKPKS